MGDETRDPWGDPAFEVAVRETAYFMWENDGRPEGREQDYWCRALESQLRERTADRELATGYPAVEQDNAAPSLRSRNRRPTEARKRS